MNKIEIWRIDNKKGHGAFHYDVRHETIIRKLKDNHDPFKMSSPNEYLLWYWTRYKKTNIKFAFKDKKQMCKYFTWTYRNRMIKTNPDYRISVYSIDIKYVRFDLDQVSFIDSHSKLVKSYKLNYRFPKSLT